MLGSAFVAQYARKGYAAWERAVVDMAKAGDGLVPWPWAPLTLTDPNSADVAVLQVRSDVLAVGSVEDHVRVPLTPVAAQNAMNAMGGALLPTPWIVYQMWSQATVRLEPTAMVPNRGADLEQYANHSTIIDRQLADAGYRSDLGGIVAGHKKAVVVSNIARPGKVLIFGWYRPSPPAPAVFDDGTSMESPTRQPVQPRSNVHGDFYVDYSHGIHVVHPECLVNGQTWRTQDLYQHLTLSRLVSNESPDGRIATPGSPVKQPRYPSPTNPKQAVALYRSQVTEDLSQQTPSNTDLGLGFALGGGLRSV